MSYPPYGLLNVDHLMEYHQHRVPELWTQVASEAAYDAWIDTVRDEIKNGLWPAWEAGEWVGDAKSQMEALTMFDLPIMWSAASFFDDPVSALPGAKKHQDLFRVEDLQRGGMPGDLLTSYHADLDPDKDLSHSPHKIYRDGGKWACGATAILLKHSLQRPRAFQIALWKNMTAAVPRHHGTTADSPSMISGHCLEGCLAGSWLVWYLQFKAQGQGVARVPWDQVRPALQQWAVDVGDRRVMAQIHYPSDNMGSWWVALRFLREIESHASEAGAWMRVFLQEAIRKSRIYQAIAAQPSVPAALWPMLVEAVNRP